MLLTKTKQSKLEMSSGVEHLYHDAAISNNFSSLEAKDKLKARQQQAREEKQLKKFHKTLERAHTVLIKRQDWEKSNVEQDLNIIKLKTPSLNKGLRREEDAENSKVEKLPIISKSSNSLVKSFLSESASSSRSSNGKPSLRRNVSMRSPDLRYSADVVPMEPKDFSLSDDSATVYMKKANIVTRNLHRLYKRKQERYSYIQEAAKVLRQSNQDLFGEAKIYMGKIEQLGHSKSQKKAQREKTICLTNVDGKSSTSEKTGTSAENDNFSTQGNGVSLIDSWVESGHKIGNSDHNFRQISHEIKPATSVMANASETGSEFDDRNNKWTDIFRIPEMWKVFDGRKKIQVITQPAPPALMTIRGKLRKTLLK